MVFYKDANGLYNIGDSIVPASTVVMNKYAEDTIVDLVSTENVTIMPATEVVQLEREDGSNYADIDELLAENADFLQ